MNTETILAELVKERDRISAAIGALKGGGAVGNGKVRKPRGPMSEETKQQRMRDAWARRRKAAKKAAKA